ncbi:LacI family DNA-binding transcriptional regulator [Silvimonas sp.]|uniref:LacI family DNA-binding transcriptional regulator n=1 Tax=Silvimonas sp. TaxID=2650811 RepID=UPI00283D9DDF|nr:LacI family DNA-binding transcriptional regulator [Silvimonas sp.]MDR3426130.1 LacI family DNA-binding transcriptional regulator [Silvimonas sp.]
MTMKAPNKRVTMSDIGRQAGVSQASVSLVLNDAPGTRISAATREKVLKVARELGYSAPPRAESAPAIIGLLINHLAMTPHVAALLEGARDEAASSNCMLATIATHGDEQIENEALNYLLSRPLKGIIYATLLTQEANPPDRLRDVPTVMLNCHYSKQHYPSVVPADIAGGVAATTALLDAGHRRIAFISSGEDWIEGSRDRLLGYRQALATYDIPVDPALIVSPEQTHTEGWTQRGGREQTHALLDLPLPPTAIFCFCDRMALGAYEAIKSRGLRIPEDISVIGFDDEVFASSMEPPLSTLVLPHEEMGRWAVARLLDFDPVADRQRKHRTVKIECPLVLRGSIANPNTSASQPIAPARN